MAEVVSGARLERARPVPSRNGAEAPRATTVDGWLAEFCRIVIGYRALPLLVTLVYIPLRDEDAPPLSAALILAALASYLPVRYWQAFGPRLMRRAGYLVADLALAFCVLALAGPESPFFYFTLGTPLLAGILHGARGAVFFSLLLLLGYGGVLALRVGSGESEATFQTLVGLPALYPLCAAGAASVRKLLDGYARVERELSATARVAAASQERALIAREMHDSLTKTLHGVSLLATALAVRAERDPEAVRAEARELARAAETATAEARHLIGDLRGDRLEAPLARTIEDYVERWSSELEIEARVEVRQPELVSPMARYELFGILREALSNVERHARARLVEVTLEGRDGGVLLRVADDGAGFACSGDLRALEPPGHWGLIGMSERAERLGGRLELASAPGRGTTVSAFVPALAGDRDAAPLRPSEAA